MQLPILVVNDYIDPKVVYRELLDLIKTRAPAMNIRINSGGIILRFSPPTDFFPLFSVEYAVRKVLNYTECSEKDIEYMTQQLRNTYNPTSSL